MTLLDRHARIEALAAASTEETTAHHIAHFRELYTLLLYRDWWMQPVAEDLPELIQTVMDLEDTMELLKILGVYVGAVKGTALEGL